MIASICSRHDLHLISTWLVHGGDINEAFGLNTGEGMFFLKLNDATAFPGMFEKEADGLQALKKATFLKVPEVLAVGEVAGKQYMILEWVERGTLGTDSWALLAEGIAALHKVSNLQPGWHQDNYIGSLVQKNTVAASWADFYEQSRIMPLVRLLRDRGAFTKAEVSDAGLFCKKLNSFFPDEPVALLHGDLWSGNYFIAQGGLPAIYDPAVYFGHREMDLGMTRLFGGFDKEFYYRYNEIYALEKGWINRLPVTQLYPLLVHAILFGGHYVQQCSSIISSWK